VAKIAVNHDVLKWARESSNLSLEDVAHRMKKSIDIIQAWEEGHDTPTYAQLEKLAYDIYKRPLAVFFFPNPPKEESLKSHSGRCLNLNTINSRLRLLGYSGGLNQCKSN
jgi:transcriptional regulator with XRE-family HTH domain